MEEKMYNHECVGLETLRREVYENVFKEYCLMDLVVAVELEEDDSLIEMKKVKNQKMRVMTLFDSSIIQSSHYATIHDINYKFESLATTILKAQFKKSDSSDNGLYPTKIVKNTDKGYTKLIEHIANNTRNKLKQERDFLQRIISNSYALWSWMKDNRRVAIIGGSYTKEKIKVETLKLYMDDEKIQNVIGKIYYQYSILSKENMPQTWEDPYELLAGYIFLIFASYKPVNNLGEKLEKYADRILKNQKQIIKFITSYFQNCNANYSQKDVLEGSGSDRTKREAYSKDSPFVLTFDKWLILKKHSIQLHKELIVRIEDDEQLREETREVIEEIINDKDIKTNQHAELSYRVVREYAKQCNKNYDADLDADLDTDIRTFMGVLKCEIEKLSSMIEMIQVRINRLDKHRGDSKIINVTIVGANKEAKVLSLGSKN